MHPKDEHRRIYASGETTGNFVQALTKKQQECGHRLQTGFFAERHVETKPAYRMMMSGERRAAVVINHESGACEGRDSCTELVKAILPKGYQLTVYHPSSETPDILIGEGPGK